MQLITMFLCIITMFPIYLQTCPTCVGLPRPGEPPFFARKSFITVIRENYDIQKKITPLSQQKQGMPRIVTSH